MRTTVILKSELLEQAKELSGVQEKTKLIHMGLEALIEKLARERLIALGGYDPKASAPKRKRSQ